MQLYGAVKECFHFYVLLHCTAWHSAFQSDMLLSLAAQSQRGRMKADEMWAQTMLNDETEKQRTNEQKCNIDAHATPFYVMQLCVPSNRDWFLEFTLCAPLFLIPVVVVCWLFACTCCRPMRDIFRVSGFQHLFNGIIKYAANRYTKMRSNVRKWLCPFGWMRTTTK